MLDLKLKAKLLEAPMIIKGFVKGEAQCNYEIYLRELLNASAWFQNKYGALFIAPESEAHGECDAISNQYRLDFKLFASRTSLQARSIFSEQISVTDDGAVCWSICKNPDSQMLTTRLHAAFRGMTYSELLECRQSKIKENGIEKDILTALQTLETQKNILLFFPFLFSFDNPPTFAEAIKSIEEGINNDFGEAFRYREETANGFDTFFTCLYGDSFLLFQIIRQKIELIDTVPVCNVPTFDNLKDYTSLW